MKVILALLAILGVAQAHTCGEQRGIAHFVKHANDCYNWDACRAVVLFEASKLANSGDYRRQLEQTSDRKLDDYCPPGCPAPFWCKFKGCDDRRRELEEAETDQEDFEAELKAALEEVPKNIRVGGLRHLNGQATKEVNDMLADECWSYLKTESGAFKAQMDITMSTKYSSAAKSSLKVQYYLQEYSCGCP